MSKFFAEYLHFPLIFEIVYLHIIFFKSSNFNKLEYNNFFITSIFFKNICFCLTFSVCKFLSVFVFFFQVQLYFLVEFYLQ